MPFYSISDEQRYNSIADQIIMREKELFSYDLNITNYTAMLQALPQGEWSAELVQYKTSTLDQIPDDLDEVVSQYQFRDRIRYLIKTEKAERAKSNAVYTALISLLPADQKDELMAAAVQRAG
jgi:Lon protease-like protein